MRAPVLVGVMAHPIARFTQFYECLHALELPDGAIGCTQIGASIPHNCNELVRTALENDVEALFMIGDDHTFAPHLVRNLLAHEVDIVAPLCLQHAAPFLPTAFLEEREYLPMPSLLRTGLIKVHSCGAAGMLIRREVLETLDDPWFEGAQEDIYFCEKATEAGFDIHLDLANPLGHLTTVAVVPSHTKNGWTFGFEFLDGFQLQMPVGTWKEEKKPVLA